MPRISAFILIYLTPCLQLDAWQRNVEPIHLQIMD